MALSISAALQRIKADLGRWLTPAAINQLCHEAHYDWRDRILDPVTTIHLFVLQILNGNTACAHVPRLGHVACTGEAYGQARARLPLSVFDGLLSLVTRLLPASTAPEGRWHGHRTLLIDGSSASMPDAPALQKEYGQPTTQAPGCGFPVLHLVALFQAATGFLLSMVSAPYRTHDMSQVGAVLPDLQNGDLLIGDRGFCSFTHLALLSARGLFGLFRTHQRQIVSFRSGRRSAAQKKAGRRGKRRKSGQKKKVARRGGGVPTPTSRWVKRLGPNDQWVEYVKPVVCPEWLSAEAYAALPDGLVVRELRYRIRRPGCRVREVTLTTTLLDAEKYPVAELAELYHQRWEAETNLRHLKTTLQMDVLRCKTVEGVQKELLMYALVYNLVRLVMLEASRRQGVDVRRISFVDAVRWLAEALRGVAPLKLRVNPDRPDRVEPRVRKRRPKEYDLMNRPRQELRNLLLGNTKAA
jgi:hypothetical protein